MSFGSILVVGFMCGLLVHLAHRKSFFATSVLGAGVAACLCTFCESVLSGRGQLFEIPDGKVFVASVAVFPVVLAAGLIVRCCLRLRVRWLAGQRHKVKDTIDTSEEAPDQSGLIGNSEQQHTLDFIRTLSRIVCYLVGYSVCVFLCAAYIFSGSQSWRSPGGLWLWGGLAWFVCIVCAAWGVRERWGALVLYWTGILAMISIMMVVWHCYA